MSTWPDDNCECVQGIEHFIDPRVYIPSFEMEHPENTELPLWEKAMLDSVIKDNEAATASESSKNVLTTSDRCINLVVQGNTLINKDYTHLVGHQINSYYICLNSLDTAWRNANVSLILNHKETNKSSVLPVVSLGTKVVIPKEFMVPGTLSIAAMAINKVGDYSVITTEALEFQVYDPKIKRVEWPEMKSYDVYYYFQTLVKKLLTDFQTVSNRVPIKVSSTIVATITDKTDPTLSNTGTISYLMFYANEYVSIEFPSINVINLNAEHEYEIKLSLPFSDLGITVSDTELQSVAAKLNSNIFVKNDSQINLETLPVIPDNDVAAPMTLLDYDTLDDNVDLKNISTVFSALPEITISIPATVNISKINLGIQKLYFNREVQS